MIDGASEELARRVSSLLQREALGQITQGFSTPRRLAVQAEVIERQSDTESWTRGPSANVAYKDGSPTRAAEAFAAKAGIKVEQLKVEDGYVVASVTKKGRLASEILAEKLPKEIASLYWPKNMYWRKRSELFVRPVRWLVAMLDDQVVPMELFGIPGGKTSRGHRILFDVGVTIPRAGAAYVSALKDAKVLSRDAREAQIRKALDAATRTIPGARWREDEPLLATVVNLTEFPSVILGGFDPEFLALPEEVLVTVMRDHQKYFAIEDANGKLLAHFLAVLNTAADSDGLGVIQHGNERVLRARFNDARFFWQTDQKHDLRERVELLKHVTFQKDLGSYYEKTLRVQRLASWLAETVRQNGMAIRPGVVHKAALLAKTDLTTELVKEFTELQGIVGGLYAKAQQLDSDLPEATRFAIADAIYDHYKPESIEDEVPRTVEGAVLSIADKADSIAGMFGLGLVPSGSKDPFALRRQANGIVKTIAEHKLPFRLSKIMADARSHYQGSEAEQKFANPDFFGSVRSFFRERLEFYLKDVRGHAYDAVNAVLAADDNDVVDAVARAEALTTVRNAKGKEFEDVCVSFKRINNILKQAEEKGFFIPEGPPEDHGGWLLGSMPDAEKELYVHGAVNLWAQYDVCRNRGDYLSALASAANLRPLLARFFDEIMVMVDDERARANRLGILKKIYTNFSTIADFSEIVTEGRI